MKALITKALITGATGYIGRHLAAELIRRQWQVTALVRHRARGLVLGEQVARVIGDLGDEQAMREAVSGMDVVFHLGATIDGPWERHREDTVEGTRRLLRISAEAGVRRFVFASSLAVYDKRRLRAAETIDEDWPLAPADVAGPYGRGKIEAEALVRESNTPPMANTVVRPGLTYGRGRTILPHLGSVAANRFIALGTADLLLPLVHIDSLVDAFIRIGTEPAAAGKTYQVVDDEAVTRGEYLATLNDLSGQRHRALYLPAAPVALAAAGLAAVRRFTGVSRLPDVSAEKLRMRAVEARYATTRLKEDTGWRPLVSLREGLAQSLGVRENGPQVTIERVGIIGAGRVAPFHLEALTRLKGVQVTGILDLDADAARALAARYGGLSHFSDADRFYREAAPQLVHVLTPPHTHMQVALEAVRRGVHVLLEKPAVPTIEACDALCAAARAADVTVGVDENFILAPGMRQARARLARGDLGELVHISAFFGFDVARAQYFGAGARPWYGDLAGGLLEDLLPHPLSVSLALAGRDLRPTHWSVASTGRLPHAIDDELRLALADDDLTADLAVSLTSRPDDFVITAYGTRATLRIDLQNMLLDVGRFGPGPRAVARGARVLGSGLRMMTQTAANVFAILSRRELPPGTPLHLIRAHYAALAQGRDLPAPLDRARRIVDITRTIWPASPPSPADRPLATEERAVGALPNPGTPTGAIADGPPTGQPKTPRPSGDWRPIDPPLA